MKSSKGGINRSCLRVFIAEIRNHDQRNLEEFSWAHGSRGIESMMANQKHSNK